jgi:hypothetical protein
MSITTDIIDADDLVARIRAASLRMHGDVDKTEAAMEQVARRRLKASGYSGHKSRRDGTWMVVDANTNAIVYGHTWADGYGLSVDDVLAFAIEAGR